MSANIQGATTMAGGVADAVLHPVETALGVESMLEHIPAPLGLMMRAGHDLFDVARGQRSLSGMIQRTASPAVALQEDRQFWGRIGSALIDPYRASMREGRHGEAVGRGAFDIGSLLIGAGELGCRARHGRG